MAVQELTKHDKMISYKRYNTFQIIPKEMDICDLTNKEFKNT